MKFKSLYQVFLILFTVLTFACKNEYILKTEEIRIRDPFILADENTNIYYLYAQIGNRNEDQDNLRGVEVYKSRDLQNWSLPEIVFSVPDTLWADGSVWAPEVHQYKNKYFLFATLTNSDTVLWRVPGKRMKPNQRGTQIFYSNTPDGTFVPFANKPFTPKDWMSLDGTLYVENGVPYMVFCHEWIQIEDGTMEIIRLKDDLSDTIGTPETLFKATDAPWVKSLDHAGGNYYGYITDGPFFYKTKNGKLLMIWSSFGEEKYAVGLAESESGSVLGPWNQLNEPLFKANGGHGMIFKGFDGKTYLIIHQPNNSPDERMKLIEVQEKNDLIYVK